MKREVLEEVLKRSNDVIGYTVEGGCCQVQFRDGLKGKGVIGNNQNKLVIEGENFKRTLFKSPLKGTCTEYKSF